MESREHLLQSFLSKTNWKKATRIPLASDASGRTYERLSLDSNCAILMNAPYATGEDVRPFITVTNILNDLNLSAPVIYHQDIQNGFLLLEDLGNDLFASICKKSPEMENLIYSAAVDLLLYLHEKPTPPSLSKYDLKVYVREAKLLVEWYLPFALGRPISKEIIKEFDIILNTTFSKIPSKNPVLVMRDYHAENLIWLPKRLNVNKVGLLDYQDALVGHPAYDLVSLLEDARRDTTRELQDKMFKRYLSKSNINSEEFISAYNLLGAQRNIKIMGIFARLSVRDKKSEYINLIPRVWKHLMNNLNHSECLELKKWININVPPPNITIRHKLKNIT